MDGYIQKLLAGLRKDLSLNCLSIYIIEVSLFLQQISSFLGMAELAIKSNQDLRSDQYRNNKNEMNGSKIERNPTPLLENIEVKGN